MAEGVMEGKMEEGGGLKTLQDGAMKILGSLGLQKLMEDLDNKWGLLLGAMEAEETFRNDSPLPDNDCR